MRTRFPHLAGFHPPDLQPKIRCLQWCVIGVLTCLGRCVLIKRCFTLWQTEKKYIEPHGGTGKCSCLNFIMSALACYMCCWLHGENIWIIGWNCWSVTWVVCHNFFNKCVSVVHLLHVWQKGKLFPSSFLKAVSYRRGIRCSWAMWIVSCRMTDCLLNNN